jgi:hypothetical protein
MALGHLQTSFHRLHQSRFEDVQKADYEFSGPFAYLKHHSRDFIEAAFFFTLEAENDFVWHFDTLKNRFIDFKEVVF